MQVTALWRYPVKSMMGEELNRCEVTERGLVGDRAYALIDVETAKVVSAKNPKLWPSMFDCRATFVEPPEDPAAMPPVRIELPDGETVRSDDPSANEKLSRSFGREVKLAAQAPEDPAFEDYWPDVEGLSPEGHRDTVTTERLALAAPEGTFFDLSALHVFTTSSLESFRKLYPGGRWEPRRFRANVILHSPDDGFVENSWSGRTLALGDVAARVIIPAPRCVMTTLPQSDLPKDTGILRTIAQHNRVEIPGFGSYPCLGVFATVTQGGRIARGDPASLRD